MNYDELKSKYSDCSAQFVSIIKESASQLFKQEFGIELDIKTDQDTLKLVSNEEFPRVYIRFVSAGVHQFQHLFSVEPDFVLKLYAWMIDDEPGDSVIDEHLEGLQEGISQILGKIKASLDGEEGAFLIEEMKITLTDSENAAVTDFPEIGGVGTVCSISMEEERFTVHHYIWSNSDNSTNSKEEMVGVHPVEFDSFSSRKEEKSHSQNIEMLMDVELDVLVELGRKTMLIKDVLKLGNGSIVELDKAAGEPLEVFINGRKFAEGEVVVVDDHFGIRITHLVGPKERIMGLK
ncbi:MAG: flagellar motor switch protein FliN [Calditrichaeota bacterium]|nr:flagellar motor switch protein FliN [Calditrichota bacterium]MBT7790163.1 flagellar motor switch protein FliN [Calditrichota bacterium]